MMTWCRECEHWGENPGAEFGRCCLPGTSFFVCSDDYSDGIYTAPGFGCVAGQLKDKAEYVEVSPELWEGVKAELFALWQAQGVWLAATRDALASKKETKA